MELRNVMSHVCPSCQGKKEVLATGIRYQRGFKGKYWRTFTCERCKGAGTITDEMKQWIEHGQVLKQRRLQRRMNFVQAADELGISITALSRIELGMVDNLAIEFAHG
jgi:hypothetical protein